MVSLYSFVMTPLGKIVVEGTDQALTGIYFEGQKNMPTMHSNVIDCSQLPLFQQVQAEIEEYMVGKRSVFDVPYCLNSSTMFEQKVWQALSKIPYGTTMSYSQLARMLLIPQRTRAVASAVARNPLLFIIPCHRIIRADGSLGGFAAGIALKKRLLELEQIKR